LPESWVLSYGSLRFMGRPTPFRHLGFFPEQAVHWEWCANAIRAFVIKYNRPPSILNLFAYSGRRQTFTRLRLAQT